MQKAQGQKLGSCLGETHDDIGDAQSHHGADHHGFPAVPVSQDPPERLHEGRNHERSREDEAAPNFDGIRIGHPQFLEVKREKGHHHAQTHGGRELGNP